MAALIRVCIEEDEDNSYSSLVDLDGPVFGPFESVDAAVKVAAEAWAIWPEKYREITSLDVVSLDTAEEVAGYLDEFMRQGIMEWMSSFH